MELLQHLVIADLTSRYPNNLWLAINSENGKGKVPLETTMPLQRRDDAESKLYWESVDRIAREAEQQRGSWVREPERNESQTHQQRECTDRRQSDRRRR